MVKHIRAALVALLLSVPVVSIFGILPAQAGCSTTEVRGCPVTVPDVEYEGGGVDVKSYPATACFTQRIGYDITLPNRHVGFVGAFVYRPNGINLEKIKTIEQRVATRGDQVCWSHNVPVGTWMAVYVTCESYTGWVAVLFTGQQAEMIMEKQMDWDFLPPWLNS